jgi:HCOMODA/2-hydroxy-3-carboxy-muconic semialdehyde decarboxylase
MTPAFVSGDLVEVREKVAAAGRMLAQAGLVGGFGHASVRMEDGRVAITSTLSPLSAADPDEVVICDAATIESDTQRGRPLETPLHLAIYACRHDIGAICRTHSHAAVVLGCLGEIPPICHGLGGLSGPIEIFGESRLVSDETLGTAAAAALGKEAVCMISRGNGSIASAGSLEQALVRAWYLEERCRVWLDSGRLARPLDDQELLDRSKDWAIESGRAWRWLSWKFGSDSGSAASVLSADRTKSDREVVQ